MPPPASLDEAVAAVHALKGGVSVLNTEIALLRDENMQIKQVVTRQKRGMRILVVSVAVDIALSVAALAGGFIIKNLADKANEQSSAAVTNCRAANELGHAQKQLWGPLLDAPPPADETAESRESRVQFKATIDRLATPKDCDHL